MKHQHLLLVASVLLSGCGQDKAPASAPVAPTTKPVVMASNYPLAYFAERLAGEGAAVWFPVPSGEDPAFWEPGEADIAAMQKADLILLNGADYEHWLRTATVPEDRLVNTSESFAESYRRSPDTVTHSHGPGGAHEHGVLEFTTWLDPQQAILQAGAVRDALKRLLPSETAGIEARAQALIKDLDSVDKLIDQAARAWGPRPLLASHPVYGYLARRYRLPLESLHWEPGEFPSEDEWARLAALLKKHPAGVMLWEDDPLPQTATRLQSLGVRVVVFRPCGNRPPAGDYLAEMCANAERLDHASRGAQHDGP